MNIRDAMQKIYHLISQESTLEEFFPHFSSLLEEDKSIADVVLLNERNHAALSQTGDFSEFSLYQMLEQKNNLVRSYPIGDGFYLFVFYHQSLEDDTDIRLLVQLINIGFTQELEVLRKENKVMKSVISAIPEMLAFKDVNGTYRYLSKEAEQYYDKFDKVEGHTVQELYSKREARVVSTLDMEVIRKKKQVRRQIKIDTKDGFIDVDSIRSPVYVGDEVIGVVSISRNISDIIKTKRQLEQKSAFQDILMKIAVEFINVPLSKSNETINRALALVGSFLETDRAYVFEYDFINNLLPNTYEWCNQGIEPQIEYLQDLKLSDYFEGWIDKHKIGEVVRIENVEKLNHSTAVYKTLSMQDIQSMIALPMLSENECLGFVGFDSVKELKTYSEEEETLLYILAQLISNLQIRQKNQEKLERSMKEASAANKSKANFLRSVGHEIRTPLTGVYNALSLLNEQMLDSKGKEYLDIMSYSLNALTNIVDNILDYTKIKNHKIQYDEVEIDLEDELYQIYQSQKYFAHSSDIDFSFNYDFKIADYLYGDIKKIKQVLFNLVHNAIKFTDEGSVVINATLEKVKNQQQYITFSVSDTGVGITEEDQKHLFKDFFQVKSNASKKYDGSGLGLPISKELVSFLGGDLNVESVLDEGTTFSFTIPFRVSEKIISHQVSDLNVMYLEQKDSDKDMEFIKHLGANITINTKPNEEDNYLHYDMVVVYITVENKDFQFELSNIKHQNIVVITDDKYESYDGLLHRDAQVLYAPLSRKKFLSIFNDVKVSNTQSMIRYEKKKVLLVDDNKINLIATKSLLENYGIYVTDVNNGHQAVDLLKTRLFDLVFMDVQMPGMDGFETTKQIRKFNTTIPVVALTAHAHDDISEEISSCQLNDVLTKPINNQKLETILMKYLDKEIHNDEIYSSFKKLTIFDEEDFRTQFNYNNELIIELIDTFLGEYQRDVKILKDYITKGDIKKVKNQAHYLKSSFAYLSGIKMAKICQVIMGGNPNTDYHALYFMFENELEQFVTALMKFKKSLRGSK